MTVAGRLVAILSGYIVAVLAAALFIGVLFFSLIPFEAGTPPGAYAGSLVVALFFFAPLVGYIAFLPALCIVVLTEVLHLRDWLFHALGGGAVGLLATAWLWRNPERSPAPPDAGFLMVLIGAGMVGGMAYWLVAGRAAGEWGHSKPQREE